MPRLNLYEQQTSAQGLAPRVPTSVLLRRRPLKVRAMPCTTLESASSGAMSCSRPIR